MKKVYIFAIVAFVLGSVGMIFAQDVIPVPAAYDFLFAAAMTQAIGSVIGFTQLINNMARLKGWPAVGLAFVVSIGYSFAMYLSHGVIFCAVVAVAAFVPAAIFYKASTVAGKAIH